MNKKKKKEVDFANPKSLISALINNEVTVEQLKSAEIFYPGFMKELVSSLKTIVDNDRELDRDFLEGCIKEMEFYTSLIQSGELSKETKDKLAYRLISLSEYRESRDKEAKQNNHELKTKCFKYIGITLAASVVITIGAKAFHKSA